MIGTIHQELIVSRLAKKLDIRQETIWARVSEMRQQERSKQAGISPQPIMSSLDAARLLVKKHAEIERVKRELKDALAFGHNEKIDDLTRELQARCTDLQSS
jgi:transposase-like protein